MKKLLAFILCITAFCSLMCMAVYADDTKFATISEDYSTVYYGGKTYLRLADTNIVSFWYNEGVHDIELTEQQSGEIENISIDIAEDGVSALGVDITFKKGGGFYDEYIEESRLEEYNNILVGNAEVYRGVFPYYSDGKNNDFILTDKQLEALVSEQPITLKGYEAEYYESYILCAESEDGYISQCRGEILVDNEKSEYYYLDYQQFDFDDIRQNGFLGRNYHEVNVYPITDPIISAEIEDGLSDDEDEYSWLDSEENGKIATAVVSTVFFGIFPFALLVLSLIFAIRSKKPYKTCFTVMTVLCAVELVCFVIIFIAFKVILKL